MQTCRDTVMSLVTFPSKKRNSGNFGAAAVAHTSMACSRSVPITVKHIGNGRQNSSKCCALAVTASGPLWMFVFTVVGHDFRSYKSDGMGGGFGQYPEGDCLSALMMPAVSKQMPKTKLWTGSEAVLSYG